MTLAIQIDFLEPVDEMSLLRKEIAIVKQQSDNTRRGLFARHGELAKSLMKMQDELDVLKGKQPIEPLEIKLFT